MRPAEGHARPLDVDPHRAGAVARRGHRLATVAFFNHAQPQLGVTLERRQWAQCFLREWGQSAYLRSTGRCLCNARRHRSKICSRWVIPWGVAHT